MDTNDPFEKFILEDHVSEITQSLSKRPVSCGGFCDLHTSSVQAYGKLAVKVMRCLRDEENATKVLFIFLLFCRSIHVLNAELSLRGQNMGPAF